MIMITMTFGILEPILFPITLAQIVVFYVVERLMIHYSYIKPPSLDETLSSNFIRYLFIAPCFLCMFAFWALSNQQVFFNKIMPYDENQFFPKTGHYLSQGFTQLTPGTPVFIGGILFFIHFIYAQFHNPTIKIINEEGNEKNVIIKDVEIGEFGITVPNYTEALNYF